MHPPIQGAAGRTAAPPKIFLINVQSSWVLLFWAKLFPFFLFVWYMFFFVKTNNNILTGRKKIGPHIAKPLNLRLLNITFDRVTYIVKKGFINIFPLFRVDLQLYICKRLAPFSQTDNMIVSLLKNNSGVFPTMWQFSKPRYFTLNCSDGYAWYDIYL